MTFVIPASGILWVATLLGEPVNFGVLAELCVMLLSVWLVQGEKKRQPGCRRRAWTCSGVAVSPSITAAGAPGIRCMREKTNTDARRKVGIMLRRHLMKYLHMAESIAFSGTPWAQWMRRKTRAYFRRTFQKLGKFRSVEFPISWSLVAGAWHRLPETGKRRNV